MSENEDIIEVEVNSVTSSRKSIAYLTWLIILFVPAYGHTETLSAGGQTNISETIYLLPWIIVIRHFPSSIYSSDQYTIITFPWSFILFIPSFYILQQTYQLYKNEDNKEQNALYIFIGAVVQWGLLYMTFRSQEARVSENLTIILLPQIFLIIFYFVLSLRWYFEKVNSTLTAN